MKTIDLASSNRSFIQQVEEESGQDVSRCYQCGNCTAGCPMDFAYDLSVNRIMRLIQLGQKDAVLTSKSLAYCVTCETCTARCPNNIAVATVMDVCRHMARREGKLAVWPVRAFGASFLKTVETFGRAYELGLMGVYMVATGRLLSDVDLMPKVLARRKLPYTPHSIKARDEVSAIFKRFREGVHEQK